LEEIEQREIYQRMAHLQLSLKHDCFVVESRVEALV
jgi:hypothetical protein